jgi:hypothetical protein
MNAFPHRFSLAALVASSMLVSLAGCAARTNDDAVSGMSEKLISPPVTAAQCTSFARDPRGSGTARRA